MERKEPSTSEVAHIGAELALFKGAIGERAEISGAVLAPINFKVAPVFFKFTLHMVQFGPYNGVNSAPKLVPKTAPFQWGRIDPKQVPNWTHSFWPHFWGQINSFNFTVWRRMTSRPGELRHEEFSHCCIHESLLETKLFFFSLRRRDVSKEKFRRTLFYNFSRTIT